MTPRRKKIAITLGIALVAIAIAFRIFAWPWLASPDPTAVATAWAAVEKATKESPPAAAADERFDAMVAAIEAAKGDFGAMGKHDTDETLPPSVKAALDALTAWANNAAIDSGPFVCPPPTGGLRGILAFRLSEIALTTPPVAAHAAVLTTLSERLRRRGGLFHYVIGMGILSKLLERAALNPQGLPPYLKDTHADGRELRATMAREAWCSDAMFDGDPKSRDGWFFRGPREREMVRLHLGDPIRSAMEVEDATEIVKRLSAPREAPKSVAVRAMVFDARSQLEKALLVIKRYDELRAK